MKAASNPRARSYWELSQYLSVLVDAAGIALDESATRRRREQALRRFNVLHREARTRWPEMFTDKGLTHGTPE